MSMRKLKEVLRLKWACGLTHRRISRAIGISVGAVSKFAAQASQAGLDWAAAEALSEDELNARRRPAATDATATASRRIEPDYAALHRELRRKGVSLRTHARASQANIRPSPNTCRPRIDRTWN